MLRKMGFPGVDSVFTAGCQFGTAESVRRYGARLEDDEAVNAGNSLLYDLHYV